MKKVLSIILLLIGLSSLGFGAYKTVPTIIDVTGLSEYNEKNPTNRKVIVRGPLVKTEDVKDDEFNVSVPSAVLVRDIQMVQWYQDEKGTRLVLANYELPSFKDGVTTYTNPAFYKQIVAKDFISSATINALEADSSVLKGVTEQIRIGKFNTTSPEKVPNDINKQYDLVIRNGEYVSEGDEWELGDVRVVYDYLNKDNSNITVVGNVKNKKVSLGINGRVYAGNVEKSVIVNDLMSTIYLYLIILGLGILFTILGFILLRKSKNKKDKKERKEKKHKKIDQRTTPENTIEQSYDEQTTMSQNVPDINIEDLSSIGETPNSNNGSLSTIGQNTSNQNTDDLDVLSNTEQNDIDLNIDDFGSGNDWIEQ